VRRTSSSSRGEKNEDMSSFFDERGRRGVKGRSDEIYEKGTPEFFI
jgi:hypothetical protein